MKKWGAITTQDSNHWCRIVSENETRKLVSSLGPTRLDALEVSGSRWSPAGFRSYESRNYPEFDICSDRLDEALAAHFDIILAEHVLEHVVDPDRALENFKFLLRPGGFVLVTTPFLIRYHPEPLDLWRWTRDGLKRLFQKHGIEVVSSGSWGNKDCLLSNLISWTPYFDSELSLENDPRYPLVVWALGKAP